MRKILFFLLLTACTSRFLTRPSFDLISVGTPIHLVEEQYGAPYDTTPCQNGITQYRYIERIANEQVHYYFLVSPEGRIIQKRLEHLGEKVQFRTP